jgi:hypothetical protein
MGEISMADHNQEAVADASGVTVTFEGSGLSTTTDSTGFWRIDSLPTRTYDITYSKQGYGTVRQYGYSFVGGGATLMYEWHFTIAPITEVTITALDAQIVDIDSAGLPTGRQALRMSLTPTVTTTPQTKSTILVIVSRSASSSIDYYPGAWSHADRLPVNTASTIQVPLEQLRGLGFQSGDTGYITAHSITGGYWDLMRRRIIIASQSPATTETFVMP